MDRIGQSKPIRWYVREWRKHLRLTQAAVANRIDTSASVISELETGERRMNEDWMAALAYAFGIEPVDLLRDPSAPTIADLLRRATPEDRDRIIDFANRLTRAS